MNSSKMYSSQLTITKKLRISNTKLNSYFSTEEEEALLVVVAVDLHEHRRSRSSATMDRRGSAGQDILDIYLQDVRTVFTNTCGTDALLKSCSAPELKQAQGP